LQGLANEEETVEGMASWVGEWCIATDEVGIYLKAELEGED
jgi:hypothetical protein